MTGRIFLYFFSFFLSWNKWSVFGLRFQMSMSNWSSSSLLHSEIKINYHVQKISHNLCFDIVVKLKRSQRQNDPSSNTAAGRDAFSSLKLFSDSPRWIIGVKILDLKYSIWQRDLLGCLRASLIRVLENPLTNSWSA